MIKTFINKLFNKSRTKVSLPKAPKGKRIEVPLSEHNIDLGLVDANAIRVVQTLTQAGFQAYIVGGAVRDMLLGLRPKDFDVATNATPEQTKVLFRRAFIIGKRFRIVHVVYGRGTDHEIIEVSTFRAILDSAQAEQISGNEKTSKRELIGKSHAVDAAGRVLRDNVWGPQIDDAARRDFTVNAMYYDPERQVVVDYHGGLKDAKKKILRMIGDPATRYREDPVRIVRAVRFAAKLGFTIEAKTRTPIEEMAVLLHSVPTSRTFDEMIKLLQTGHALASIEELHKQNLVGSGQGIFPILDFVLESCTQQPLQHAFVHRALGDTDLRISLGKSVSPSFMLSCLLWHDVLSAWDLKKREHPPFVALQEAVESVFDAHIGDISGRGRLAGDMRDIWLMQPRFERRVGNSPYTLVAQPRFRAGFDFLQLRSQVGQANVDLVAWWEAFYGAEPPERAQLIEQARQEQRQAQIQSAKSAVPASFAVGSSSATSKNDASVAIELTKKKRRRRKPTGLAEPDTATGLPLPPGHS
jgi:poly(A) polymerase